MRSPLLAMQGFSQALIEEFADRLGDTGLDYARRIERGSRRLDKLVQEVLAFRKISKQDVRLSRLELKPLVDELVESHVRTQSPDATVHNNLAGAAVLGHEAMLTQVLGNLLSNAVKFHAPDVKPVIRVSAERRDDKVRVSVCDNGIGIAAADQERIFTMFERLNPRSKFEGTGIGLAIVKKAMDRMGGAGGMRSNSPGGSCFWFELPLANSSTHATF